MLSFFTPVLKIQKNRRILRETDERMAKYSRRGIISNFVIFVLCMAVGSFADKQPFLAVALTVGLLITTLLRGYLLVRFNVLYPKAPARWRTRYFYATLLGAAWWGLIVALETSIVGITDEGPLLWLYTIVFFAMTANAFAPYKQFLTIYQSLGLIPGAFCLLFTGELMGVIYGVVVFFFIWLLHHQSEQTADNYWERLEATDALARKTESLEEEKRDTRATAQLHREYMLLLKKELRDILSKNGTLKEALTEGSALKDMPAIDSEPDNEQTSGRIEKTQHTAEKSVLDDNTELQQLYLNVGDFYQILTKEIQFTQVIFNPDSLIQHIVSAHAQAAYASEMDIELSLTPNLPDVIFGDTARLSQILDAMLDSMISQLSKGTLLVDTDYIQERGKTGQLHIACIHQAPQSKNLFQSKKVKEVQLNLDLALAIGLAEAQEGDLDISTEKNETQLRYRAKYANRIAVEPEKDNALRQFSQARVMIIHENPRILDAKRQDFTLLGCDVKTETQFKRAIPQLKSAIKENTPFSAVVFHIQDSTKSSLEFSQTLLAENECKLTHQIIMGSSSLKQDPEITELLQSPYIHWLDKPAVAKDFYRTLWDIFGSRYEDDLEQGKAVAVITPEEADELVGCITSAGLECQQFNSIKSLELAKEQRSFTYFIFAYADELLMDSYQQLQTNEINARIIAYDQPDMAFKHIQAGADQFIPAGTPPEALIRLIRTS